MRAAILIMLALAGCKTAEPIVVPKVVTTTVTRYVPVPKELAADCGNEPAKAQTYAEAKRLALVRNEYLDECTARMRKIRALEGG